MSKQPLERDCHCEWCDGEYSGLTAWESVAFIAYILSTSTVFIVGIVTIVRWAIG